MPRLRNLNAEDKATIETLIREAGTRSLTEDEVYRLWFLINPDTDYKLAPSIRFGKVGDDLYLDLWNGGIYKVLEDGSRGYVHFSDEKISQFFGGGTGGGSGKGRGGGIFMKFGPVKSKTLRNPLPQFPKVPKGVVAKFPELFKDWEKYEKEVEEWLKSVQNQLS